MAHWTGQQDYIVIGVTVNHGQRAGFSERAAFAISEGMVPEYRHNPNAVDAKAANVMYVVDGSGLANASRRVLEWTQRYLDRDLKAMVIVHQAMRDAGLEDLIREELRFL